MTRDTSRALCFSPLLILSFAVGCSSPAVTQSRVVKWTDRDEHARYAIERSEAGPALSYVQALVPPKERPAFGPTPGNAPVIPGPPSDLPPMTPVALLPEAPGGATPAPPTLEMPAFPAQPPENSEITELEAKIEAYRDELKTIISEGSGPELTTNPRVREIADKLPGMQAQLKELRREKE